MLVDLVWKRLRGAQIAYSVGTGPRLDIQLGAFQPPAGVVEAAQVGQGKIISGRAHLGMGDIGLHLAFSDLVGTEASTDGLAADQQADVALTWMADGWTVFGERLAVLDAASDEAPFAAYVHVLKSIPLATPLAVEPGARYGVARPIDGVLVHRVTLGTTLYFAGDHLDTSLNVELTRRDGEVGHAAYAQVQAGF